jgi:hypothetical protein
MGLHMPGEWRLGAGVVDAQIPPGVPLVLPFPFILAAPALDPTIPLFLPCAIMVHNGAVHVCRCEATIVPEGNSVECVTLRRLIACALVHTCRWRPLAATTLPSLNRGQAETGQGQKHGGSMPTSGIN